MRPRAVIVACLGSLACEAGVTPPAERPVLAISARDVALFAPAGSTVPDSMTVTVANNGSGTLLGLGIGSPVYLEGPAGWLTADLRDTTIVLRASAGTLAVGTYRAALDVVLGTASNSPRTIAVSFRIGESQRLALSDTVLTFAAVATGTIPPAQVLTVSNGGEGVLDEVLAEVPGTVDWLSASLASDTAPTAVVVVPSRVPPVGTYTTPLTIRSRIASPESLQVTVTFVVAPPPQLVLSTGDVRLETVEALGTALVRRVGITEAKRRPLGGLAVTQQSNWLATALDVTATPATLTLTADPGGLAGDAVYRDTVVVTAAGGTPQRVAVTLVVRKGPAPRASLDAVQFTTYRTGPVPPPQVVRVENEGRGTLSGLTASVTGAPWLAASLAGTAPAALTLQVDTAGVVPGSTVAADVIIAGNTVHRDTVPVRLTVLAGPRLALSSDTLTFRADSGQSSPPLAHVLAIANGGEGVLSGFTATVVYPAGGPQNWLGAGLSGPTAPLTLTVQPAAPDTVIPPGTHVATVLVASGAASNSPDTVVVRYVVRPSGADPRMVLAAGADGVRLVRATSDPDEPLAEVGIDNLGTTELTDLRATTPSWLDARFTKPSGNARRTPTLLQLTANSASVPPNTTLTGTVILDSDESNPISVPVSVTVARPTMVVTGAEVRFQAYQGQSVLPDTQRLTVSNGRAGALAGVSVVANSVPSWLSAQPTASSPPPTTVVLRPATTALAPLTYRETLRLASSGAANTPLLLPVVFQMDSGPTIAASPGLVTMSGIAGGEPDTLLVSVTNVGRGTLGNLRLGATRAWLAATLDASSAPATLTLVASPAGQAAGVLRDTVRVLSGDAGNVARVVVTFDVAPPPTLGLSPANLVFHATAGDVAPPGAQAVSVFDAGSGTLGEIMATADVPWLDVTVDSSTVPATVGIRPTEVLPALDTAYRAGVTISSSLATNPPRTATVRYRVAVPRGPVILLSRDSLAFDRAAPPAQTVRITNGGSGTLRELRVRETTGVDWLFVLLDSRVAPATLTVAVNSASAADEPANSSATLEITGEGAVARRIAITLR